MKFLYKYVHGLHHKYNTSETMTPWCSIAFNPLDGMIQASPYVIGLFFVPVHYFTHIFMLFFSGVWATNIHDSMVSYYSFIPFIPFIILIFDWYSGEILNQSWDPNIILYITLIIITISDNSLSFVIKSSAVSKLLLSLNLIKPFLGLRWCFVVVVVGC